MQLSPAQTQNTCYGSTAKLNWGSLEQAKKMVKKMDNQSNMAVMTPFCPGFKLSKCINSIAKHHMLLSHQSETVSHSLLRPISPTAELILPYTTTVHTLNHTGTSNKKKKKKIKMIRQHIVYHPTLTELQWIHLWTMRIATETYLLTQNSIYLELEYRIQKREDSCRSFW